jgi:hypothetical protein
MAATLGGIYRTADAGDHWIRNSDVAAVDFARQGSTILALADRSTKQGVLRSTDNGATWQQAVSGLNDSLGQISAIAADGEAAFVGFSDLYIPDEPGQWGYGGIYRSTDGGASWSRANEGLPVKEGVVVPIRGLAAFGNAAVAVAFDALYYSQDNGMHWTKSGSSVAVGNAPVRVLAADGTFYISYGHILLRSSDGGANWEAETVPSTVENITGLSAVNGIPLLGGEISGPVGQPPVYKVFRRGIDGWHEIGTSVPDNVSFASFVVSGDQVLAGSVDNSVWRVPLSNITGAAGVDVAGHAATGLGAFPNPASSEITIVFTTPSNGDARVTISDATGREVATLHDGFLAAGVHMLRWNVAGFPNGAYFYKISSNGRVNTGTVIKNDR